MWRPVKLCAHFRLARRALFRPVNAPALSAVAHAAVQEAAAADPRLIITRVGVTGQMHGVVRWQAPRGGKGPPGACSSLVTWEDRRCNADFVQHCNHTGGSTTRAWPLASGYGCTTLAWYAKHSPEQLDSFDRVGTVMVRASQRHRGRAWPASRARWLAAGLRHGVGDGG